LKRFNEKTFLSCAEKEETVLDAWQMTENKRENRLRSKRALRLRMYFTLAVVDALAISASFWAACYLLYQRQLPALAFEQLAMFIPLFLIIANLNRSYSTAALHDRWASVGFAVNALLLAAGAVILMAFFMKVSSEWSRLTFVGGVCLSLITVSPCRYMLVRHAHRMMGDDPYNVMHIFDGVRPADTASLRGKAIFYSSDMLDTHRLDPSIYDRLAKDIRDADRVIVHCAEAKRKLWARVLKGANVQGEVIAPELSDLQPLGVAQRGNTPTLIVSRGPLDLKDRLIKRIFDLLIAGSLLLLVSPMLFVVALIIFLQDRGPIFFVQIRVGRSNQMFHIYKFRSMYVEDSDLAGSRSASRGDDRITPFGRFIRATSIDEIPQLFNVLKGDMSIVGPRPHALGSTADNKLFWHIDERYWHRHIIKPGLTGLAQVRGYRGATIVESDLVNRLQSDLEYVQNWTLWRDITILVRTAGVLLHKNAY
jgi:exopolysaccharide biosynthesis polyprenyl glycosylphosphotransferase